jgi:hypothetical protein
VIIAYWQALLVYIPVAALCMLDRNSARGFTLAVIPGMLFLPEAEEIVLPGIPNLDKLNVIFIGIFIGTILFRPRAFDRFTLLAADFAILLGMLVAFLSAFLNDGSYTYCVSRMFTVLLSVVFPILLARIHIGTPAGIRTFLLGIILGSILYVPLVAWEFRMSPQIHTTVYGYFQHVFQQHARGSFWRPIVFFSHALALGRFYAFAAFLAFLPMRKDLIALLGWPGRYVFLAPLLGLFLSQSYGPYMLFVLLSVGYFVVQWRPVLAFAPPVCAVIWLAFALGGLRPGYDIVDSIEGINVDRAQSLGYRLDALEEYSSIILNRPGFGYAGYGGGRIEGRATDSQMLIALIDRGIIGAGLYFGWWIFTLGAMAHVTRRTRGTPFNRRARAITVLSSLALTIIVVDAALDLHVLLLGSAMLSVYAWVRDVPEEAPIEQLPHHAPQAAG